MMVVNKLLCEQDAAFGRQSLGSRVVAVGTAETGPAATGQDCSS
ncbi:hypothetical protein [Secundilactobacillus odoratitofui]|nr:hypothetical protein [Secundilactobacillus odoratitofui]